MKLQVMEAIIETYGDIIKGLRNEINIASDGITDLNDVIKDLQAELDKVRKGNIDTILTMNVDNEELQAELMESRKKCRMMVNKADELQADKGALYDHNTHLQAEIKTYIKSRDKRIDMIKELKADNSLLQSEERKERGMRTHESNKRGELQAEIKELKAEIKELKADNTKHYPKEYKAEAEEYFSNNPQAEKLFFFMVSGSDVDEDGDVTNTLNVGVDVIAEFDNNS